MRSSTPAASRTTPSGLLRHTATFADGVPRRSRTRSVSAAVGDATAGVVARVVVGVVAGVIATALVAASPAQAFWGVLDESPAATLLIPYFEVGLGRDPNNTVISVTNTDDSGSVVAHATLWTDLGLPTINFNIVLPALGTVEVDLGRLFARGDLPFPAFGGPSCAGLDTDMPTTVRNLTAAHTGLASLDLFGGSCGGLDYGDSIARGFVTIDVVHACATDTPLSEAYFMNNALEANVLTGHYEMRRGLPPVATSAPAVHIEADSSFTGLESFYYRFGPIQSTIDGREPLAVAEWTTAYTNDLSEVICWRDRLLAAPFNCNNAILSEFPSVTVRDHSGKEDLVKFSHGLCGYATVKVAVGDVLLEAVSKSGSLEVEIIPTGVAVLSGGFTPRAQTWMSAIHHLHPHAMAIHVPAFATADTAPPPLAISGSTTGPPSRPLPNDAGAGTGEERPGDRP